MFKEKDGTAQLAVGGANCTSRPCGPFLSKGKLRLHPVVAAQSVGTGKKAEARIIPNFLACPVSVPHLHVGDGGAERTRLGR